MGRLKQIGIYVGKNLRLFKNEKGWKNLVFALIISILVSIVQSSEVFTYTSATYSGMFTIVSACIWIGLFNSIQAICKERAIIKREHRTGLHMSSYYIAHAIVQAMLCVGEALILIIVTAIVLSYPDKALMGNIYAEYFITYFLIMYGADLLGLTVSSMVKNGSAAMTVMPFILIFQLIFSGALFSLGGTAAHISDLTLTKWGMQGACISADYNGLENTEAVIMQRKAKQMIQENGITISDEAVDKMVDEYFAGEKVAAYTYTKPNLMKQWAVLLIHHLVYVIAGILCLEFIDREKR